MAKPNHGGASSRRFSWSDVVMERLGAGVRLEALLVGGGLYCDGKGLLRGNFGLIFFRYFCAHRSVCVHAL